MRTIFRLELCHDTGPKEGQHGHKDSMCPSGRRPSATLYPYHLCLIPHGNDPRHLLLVDEAPVKQIEAKVFGLNYSFNVVQTDEGITICDAVRT